MVSRVPLAPSRDLYCIELIAAPRIVGVSGRVELTVRPGPFTVDVTAAGVLRFSPVINLEGLPAPASLGQYSTYVAWIATPVMDHVSRLGEVRNGRAELPPIALDKFIILVTAEPSANVTAPSGPFILRGASPSTRLQPAGPDAVHTRCDSRARLAHDATSTRRSEPAERLGALDDGPDAAESPDAARGDDAAPERRALSAVRQRSNAARATASADTAWQRRHAAPPRRA